MLTLIKDLGMQYPTETSIKKFRYGIYECECGKTFKYLTSHVLCGSKTHCGCKRIVTNISKHRLYSVWSGMMQRCYDKNASNFNNYGGRGIIVCESWKISTNFINDMQDSFVEGLTLDRIEVNGNYEPSNCRWATRSEQSCNVRLKRSNNKSGYRGVYFHAQSNKYIARVRLNNKSFHLGKFISPIDAAIAYDKYVAENNLNHTKNGLYIT